MALAKFRKIKKVKKRGTKVPQPDFILVIELPRIPTDSLKESYIACYFVFFVYLHFGKFKHPKNAPYFPFLLANLPPHLGQTILG